MKITELDRVARFAVTPDFLVDIMKHGIEAARIVENPLPVDAICRGVVTDGDMLWVVVESVSFMPVERGAQIPELPKTTFTKIDLRREEATK